MLHNLKATNGQTDVKHVRHVGKRGLADLVTTNLNHRGEDRTLESNKHVCSSHVTMATLLHNNNTVKQY